MEQPVILSVALVITLTISLVQVFKGIDEEKKYARFYPLFSLLTGLALGMLFALGWLNSFIVGLAAAGTYDFGKQTLKIGAPKE